jgi:hypothetical protein
MSLAKVLNNEYRDPTPNPGSPEAYEQGCLCPILDNHYGKGRGKNQFWINANCPLHGSPPEEESQPEEEKTND